MASIQTTPIDTQVAGTIESLCLSEKEKAVALDLLCSISVSIERHLTPRALEALASRGVSRHAAIEYLAHRALESVIEAGRAAVPA